VGYRTLTTIAALSLLAAVIIAALWPISYYRCLSFSFCHYTKYPDCDLVHRWNALSAAGGLRFEHHIDHFVKGDGGKLRGFHPQMSLARTYPFFGTRSLIPARNKLTFLQQAGFEINDTGTGTPPSVIRGVIAPHWFAMALLLIPPALWVRYGLPIARGKRWAKRGLCVKCGYDLRAASGRCPECGADAPAIMARSS
jgi:hypothetical protein